ncbi:MAG: Asp-tRNA(Asn)/Glu-tRNA(Gln) amidotransferase subunit GatA [Dehalococcoidia bacterium]|nr:Asp-tRNA(Asn)/Glu-tRNA(Gln) amidotransferase subunit GatA [Dehalococcoidia bacterium]
MIERIPTIHEAHQLLVSKQLSSVELTEAVLARIQAVEPRVKAFVSVTEETALQQAILADKRIAKGEARPLTGIPAVMKDLLCTKGIRTTCSSKMLDNYVPPFDATVIEKLYAEGMVLVGKANMDEFGMGSSTENSAFFPTHNPWNIEYVPGGSSGGSAAAVAAGEGLYALGSDTGGSIRQPAGFCSVIGLKPTYGRVSRYGLIAFASSLDQIGPLTQDVEDAAIVLSAIAGHDSRDSTSVKLRVPDYTQSIGKDIKGMRIGVPKEYFVEGMQPEVKQAIVSALTVLEGLGAHIDFDISLPNTACALAVYYIISPSEASANLARFDGVRYGFSYTDTDSMWEALEKTRQFGFGPEVKRRIMLGTYTLSAGYYDAYYLKAQKVRTLIRNEFEEAFNKYDVLVTPTCPTVPFKIGERVDDLLSMYLTDVCTLPISIAGVPAISVPAGFAGGLPIGLQVIAKPFAEETILRVAHAYEQATDWHKQKPLL